MEYCCMADKTANNDLDMSHNSFDLASYNSIPTPLLLYKYFKYYPPEQKKWTERIFKNNEIYFAAPKDFNDPFDSLISFVYPRSRSERERFVREWVQNSLPELPSKVADRQVRGSVKIGDDIPHMEAICEQLSRQMQEESAVFCMTQRKDSIVMWSHYAEYHTGFCLEFRTDNSLFSQARPIIYSDDLPCQDFIEFMSPRPNRMVPWYLVTKRKDWEYEKEWRLVNPGILPGQKQYPPESLTGVILGCRMDEKNREQIKQWCREREAHPTLCEAKEKKNEFGLDIVPISY
jgi:hypothetical protein